MPPAAQAQGKVKYGLRFPPQINDLEIELFCFAKGVGLTRFEHCRNIIAVLWPKTEWNDWLEDQVRSLCEHQNVSWIGCATSGKTYAFGLYAMVWWLADPLSSTVILTSTTGKMIRRRIWPVIQKLYRSAPGYPGNMVDSRTMLQCRKGDDKSAIFAIAVAEGSTAKAVGDIQGIHNRRILVMVDEAPETPEAAFEACVNLEKGCPDFQFAAAGNPVSIFDRHGRMTEPKGGWGSINVNSEEWDTSLGVCLHFDGTKSPALKNEKLHYLYSKANLEKDMRDLGPESPSFWKFCRGFYPPEGICQTVFSENMMTTYDARGKFDFYSKAIIIAGLDPAFGGGDRPILRFAKLGDLNNGEQVIQLLDWVMLKIKADSNTPVHVQLADQVKDLCEARGVRPEHFGLDSTGEGGGLADHIVRTWGSNRIRRVEFGGSASELPVSKEDAIPCKDKYYNRVTELWFTARQFLVSGQLKGLDTETIIELCARLWEDKARRIKIESKAEMKLRVLKSPDLADSLVVLTEVARQMGANPGRVGNYSPDRDWLKAAKEADELYAEDTPEDYHNVALFDSD